MCLTTFRLAIAILAASSMLAPETRSAESVLTNQPALAATFSSEINQKVVLATMKRAAEWQLANPSAHPTTDWTQGAYYAGMMALASVAVDPKYHDAMMEMGRKND